jgi:hypothetical protein
MGGRGKRGAQPEPVEAAPRDPRPAPAAEPRGASRQVDEVQTDGAVGARAALTISEAAQACNVHRNTVRRHLDRGDFPGAYQEERTHSWYIPVPDLEAAGLRPNRFAAKTKSTDVTREEEGAALLEERRSLLSRQAELSKRAEIAEAIGRERIERLEELQIALSVLKRMGPPDPTPIRVDRAAPPAPRRANPLLLLAALLLFGVGVVLAIAVPISGGARVILWALVTAYGVAAAAYILAERRAGRSVNPIDPSGSG